MAIYKQTLLGASGGALQHPGAGTRATFLVFSAGYCGSAVSLDSGAGPALSAISLFRFAALIFAAVGRIRPGVLLDGVQQAAQLHSSASSGAGRFGWHRSGGLQGAALGSAA